MMTLGIALIALAVGFFLGHAAGWARRGQVERRRHPRRARSSYVGTPK